MNHLNIINEVAEIIGASTYLEIGVRNPQECFDHVNVGSRWGVDVKKTRSPALPGVVLEMTAEFFFERLTKVTRQRKRWRPDGAKTTPVPKTFDLIFIDGDHTYEGAIADIRNARKILAPGGAIVVHDCIPATAAEAAPTKPAGGGAWCGEVWRAFIKSADYFAGALLCKEDHGVGILWEPQDEKVRPIVVATWQDMQTQAMPAKSELAYLREVHVTSEESPPLVGPSEAHDDRPRGLGDRRAKKFQDCNE